MLVIVVGALLWSAVEPYDWATWWLEVLPVLVAVPLLLFCHRRFPLTRLVLWLIVIHALILIYGGHFTYARVPLGFWLQEWFDFSRNHYDRIGHLAHGFVPAIIAREILLRLTPLRPGRWLFFLVSCVCLAISACYELIEWWVALLSDEAAESFLGTQGDNWDTQADMLMCLIGAVTAQWLLTGLHNRQLTWLASTEEPIG